MQTRLLTLVFILFSLGLASQNPDVYFKNYTVSDGLPSNTMHAQITDNNGYLWVGTNNGLARFDGYNFKVFSKGDNAFDLPDNEITAMALHPEGHLWLGHYSGGLSLFDPANQKVILTMNMDSKEFPLADNRVLSLYQDGDSLLFIGVHYQFFQVYHLKEKRLISFSDRMLDTKTKLAPIYNVHSFYADPNNNHLIWLTTGAGLIAYDRKKDDFTWYNYHQKEPTAGLHNSMRHIVFMGDTAMYIGSWGAGLIYFNHRKNLWQSFVYDPRLPLNGTRNIIRKIAKKSETEIWVATHDSAFGYFDIPTKKFHFYKHIPDDAFSANSSECVWLHPDELGGVWAGFSVGLTYLHPNNQLLEKYDLANIESLFERTYYPYTYHLSAQKNQLILGLRDAVNIDYLDLKDNRIKTLTQLPKLNTVTRFLTTTQGFHIITFRDGVYKLENGKLIRPKITAQALLNETSTYQAAKTADGSIFLATSKQGLVVFNEFKNKFRSFLPKDVGLESTEMPNGFLSVMADNKGRVWVGGYAGVMVFLPEKESYIVFNSNQVGQDAKLKDVQNFFQDNKGRIWAVTSAAGIFELTFDGQNIEIKNHHNDKQNLHSNFISSSAMDSAGFFYLSTPLGIQVYHPDGGGSQLLNYTNGFKPFQDIATIQYTPDHYLNISVAKYFFRLDLTKTDALRGQKHHRVVLSTLALALDEELPINQEKIKLQYTQNFINFSLSSLHFANPEGVSYQYRLHGLDEAWQNANGNKGVFTNLPPGKYILEARSSSLKGEWSDSTQLLNIEIVPPFWQTWWFRAILILIFLVMVFGFYRYRIIQMQTETELKSNFEKRIVEVKLEALRAQMNPHFLFNSLNSINYFILMKKEELASDYLTKFSQLLRLVLANSRTEMVRLANEIQVLELYCTLEAMRFDKKFDYEISVAKNVDIESLNIPPMVIQPFVENAIWHGLLNKEEPNSMLTIQFENKENYLLTTIEDNGIGRQKAKELTSKSATKHKSFGLQITAERFELIKKNLLQNISFEIIDLKDDRQNAAGTRVEIKFFNAKI